MTIENALSDFLIEQQIRGIPKRRYNIIASLLACTPVSPVLTLHCRKSP